MRIVVEGTDAAAPELGRWRCDVCHCVFDVEPGDPERLGLAVAESAYGTFLRGPCPWCRQAAVLHRRHRGEPL